jgi:hypothetical protein
MALAGVLVLIGLPVAMIVTGAATSSAVGRISALLQRGAAAPATLCDHLSAGLLRSAGGHAACVSASPRRGPGGRVHDVRVRGATATAVVSGSDGAEHVRLVREAGDWRVVEIR